MTFPRVRNLCIALGAALLLSFLYLKTQAIDLETHARYVDNLRRLKELNATLNQNILQARHGVLLSYDPLVENMSEIKAVANEMREIPAFVDKTGQAEISQAVEAYHHRVGDQEKQVEQFKSQNAVLKNSLYFLPVLIQNTIRSIEAGGGQEALAGDLGGLLQNVMIYNLTFEQERVPLITNQIRVLLDSSRNTPNGPSANLQMVAAHVETILDRRASIDRLIQELVASPTSSQVDRIFEIYNRHYEAAQQRVNIYRLLLYLCAVILLGSVAYTIFRLSHTTLELQRSRERLVMAREEERRRLRRDLHDSLGAALTSITLKLDAVRNLHARDAARSDAILVDLQATTQTALKEVRRLINDLRPPALDDLGLAGALRQHAERFSQNGLRITIEGANQLPVLPAAVELAAYRIAVEALTNVIRHAQARTCQIRLRVTDELCLEVSDDGTGLPEGHRPGVGLTSMAERAAELGGACKIKPRQGGGTRLLACLPLPKEE